MTSADAQSAHYRGNTALVTGAGSGIGACLSRALVAAGAQVVCADLDVSAAAAVADPLGARAVPLDVTDAGAVRALVEEVRPEGRYFPGVIQRSSIRFVAKQRRLQERRARQAAGPRSARRTSSSVRGRPHG